MKRSLEIEPPGANGAGASGNTNGRTSDPTEASSRKSPARCVLFGNFELDLQEQTLRRNGDIIKTPGKIYQAMVVLVESPGDLVTREQLRNRLWPRDANLNYDANVNTTVNKLRQVLDDSSEGSNFIQTVPRRGYSFVAPVRYAASPSMKPSESSDSTPVAKNSNGMAGFVEALRSERARIWFTASVVTWLTVALLFASAMLWRAHKVAAAGKTAVQEIGKNIDRQSVDKR